jgi:Asp/Glu/hydantoin racemase
MDISAIASAGLDVAQSRLDKAATGIASASISSAAPVGDTVSLSQQAVSLLSAGNEFKTDLQLARVADAMHKSTLNLLG